MLAQPLAPLPPEQRRRILIATSMAVFASTVMATAINVILPSLALTLNASFATIQWVVLSYTLATIALVPIVGRMADLWGKSKLFMAGHLLFSLGGLLSAMAPDVWSLIVFRAIQGSGSAALTALSLAIVTDVYPAGERGRALGINGAMISAGIVVGPSVGGVIADLLSWRWIFVVATLTSIAAAALALRVLPSYTRRTHEQFDVIGALTLLGALVSLSLALTIGQTRGFTDTRILALFAASALLTGLFIAIERRVRAPVVDLKLFRSPALTIGLVGGSTVFISIAAVVFLMPFYLGGSLGLSPSSVGLLMSVVPMVLVVMAPIAGRLADRFGPRPVTVVALITLTFGYQLLGTLQTDTTPLGYVLRFLPIGIGMGLFQTPNNTAIMGSVSSAATGVASGLLTLTRFMGQVIGTAVLGSLWVAWARLLAQVPSTTPVADIAASLQVLALHRVVGVVQVLIGVGLVMVVVDQWRSKRRRPSVEPAP